MKPGALLKDRIVPSIINNGIENPFERQQEVPFFEYKLIDITEPVRAAAPFSTS